MITERGRRRCKFQPRKKTRYCIVVGQLHGVETRLTMTKPRGSKGQEDPFWPQKYSRAAVLPGSLLELENYSALPADHWLMRGSLWRQCSLTAII